MDRGNLSRRGFLQRSLAGMAAAGLPLWFARETLQAAEEKGNDKEPAPNDRIVMGAIGIGSPASRGRAIMNDAMAQKAVEYVAVCDVDKRHRDQAILDVKKAAENHKKTAGDITPYADFR